MTAAPLTHSTPSDPYQRISPLVRARVAGAFYAVTVIGSLFAFMIPASSPLHSFSQAANLIAGTAYIVVTLMLYDLLRPVSDRLSLLAAFFSLVGVASSHSLAFFGVYCILLGYLIYKSTFFPKLLGVLMVLAGAGLLTIAYVKLITPGSLHVVSPYAFGLDGVGEIGLTLWLLIVGLNAQRWEESAGNI